MRNLALLVLGIPSVALLVLPYGGDVSPWEAVLEVKNPDWSFNLPLLGAPFFLSIPILLAQVRTLFSKSLWAGETVAYRLLAWASLAAGLVFLCGGFREIFKESLLWVLLWLILLMAAVWTMVLIARSLEPEEASTIMLRAAWLPNAIWCAVASYSEWQVAAYLSLLTAALYTTEIALALRKARRVRNEPPLSPA